MIDYYGKLKQFLEFKGYKQQLARLEAIKDNSVEVIKMYNQYKPLFHLMNEQDNINDVPVTSTLGGDKTFTIKSEDKAAFINRLEKLGIAVDTYKIQDNPLEKSFSITFTNPDAIKMIVQMLKQSPKINQIKEKLAKAVYTDRDSSLREASQKKPITETLKQYAVFEEDASDILKAIRKMGNNTNLLYSDIKPEESLVYIENIFSESEYPDLQLIYDYLDLKAPLEVKNLSSYSYDAVIIPDGSFELYDKPKMIKNTFKHYVDFNGAFMGSTAIIGKLKLKTTEDLKEVIKLLIGKPTKYHVKSLGSMKTFQIADNLQDLRNLILLKDEYDTNWEPTMVIDAPNKTIMMTPPIDPDKFSFFKPDFKEEVFTPTDEEKQIMTEDVVNSVKKLKNNEIPSANDRMYDLTIDVDKFWLVKLPINIRMKTYGQLYEYIDKNKSNFF